MAWARTSITLARAREYYKSLAVQFEMSYIYCMSLFYKSSSSNYKLYPLQEKTISDRVRTTFLVAISLKRDL